MAWINKCIELKNNGKWCGEARLRREIIDYGGDGPSETIPVFGGFMA